MNNILRVFRYELSRNVRRRAFLFTAFGLPILIFALFFVVQIVSTNANEDSQEQLAEDAQEFLVGYVDQSGVFAGVGTLRGGEVAPFPDQAAAQDALDNGFIEAYYLIPADFAETGMFTMVLPEFSLSDISESPVNDLILEKVSDSVGAELAQRVSTSSAGEEIQFERAPVGDSVSNGGQTNGQVITEQTQTDRFWLVYAFAFLFMMGILGTNGYLMQSVIEEKESRIVEILISSVRPIQLLSGKIFALGSLGLLQIGAWIGTMFVLSKLVGGVEAPGIFSFVQGADSQISAELIIFFIVYFILGYLFFAAVYGAIGAISTSLQNGPSYAVIFNMPLILPFLMLNAFTETPHATMPVILSIFPLTSPMSMIIRLVVTDVPFVELALSISLLILTDIFMIWLAGRFFRSQSLLAGQLPKLRDIPKLIAG